MKSIAPNPEQSNALVPAPKPAPPPIKPPELADKKLQKTTTEKVIKK